MHDRYRVVLPVLLFLSSLQGCSVRLAEVEPRVPDLQMREKFPFTVALVFKASSGAVDTIQELPRECIGRIDKFGKYPFEPVFEQVVTGAFSQLFESLDAGQSLAPRKDYDLILEADLTGISHKSGCTFLSKSFVRAEGSLLILDRQFKELWMSEQNASEVTYDRGMNILDSDRLAAVVADGISRAMAALVAVWVQEAQQSYVLHKYAKSLRGLSPVEPVTAPAGAAALHSDIDDIPSRPVSKKADAYAVVIGVEQYRQQVPRADYAARDARAVAAYLTNVLGYPEENVVILLNERAAKSDFEKYFEKWLANNVDKNGTVFVYYSGHGAPNPTTGDAYLVPFDGDPSFIDETGYSLKRMYAALGKLPAQEIIVALDSCFSGAGGRSVLAKGARPLVMNLQSTVALPKNMTVLAASSGGQISSTYDEKGHGLFTYFMLKGLKNEDVVNPDGSIKMDDLFGYVKPQVERIARKLYNNEQTPQLIGPKNREGR